MNCKSFFCNVYHSWEKGLIENRNKILRQFFPKGTNFDLIPEDEIHRTQNVINDRPMKALNWNSPADVFLRLRSGYLFNVPIILQKIKTFRKCFYNFEYNKVTRYDESDIDRIMGTDGIIKSCRKIEAMITMQSVFKKLEKNLAVFANFCGHILMEKQFCTKISKKARFQQTTDYPIESAKILNNAASSFSVRLLSIPIYRPTESSTITEAIANVTNPTIKNRKTTRKTSIFWGCMKNELYICPP